MMIDTVAEFNLFQISHEGLEFFRIAVTVIIGVDGFEQLTQGKIVFAVLIPQDVAALDGGFCQEVDKLLLIERQILESGHHITKNLDVSEAVNDGAGRIVGVKSVCHCCCGGGQCGGNDQ